MASPNSPVASASANPRNANGCTCPCAAGLRATALISAEKTLPIPTPAPTRAMQARPAPIIFAEARSICVFLVYDRVSVKGEGGRRPASVQMQGVAQIEAGQDGEHIGLQHRDQNFKSIQRDVD